MSGINATREVLKDQLALAADEIIRLREGVELWADLAERRADEVDSLRAYTGWPQVRDRLICVAAGAVIASAGWLL